MATKTQNVIAEPKLRTAMSYTEYLELIDDLLDHGKTTGPNQSEQLTEYTRMNMQRMRRLSKTTEHNDSLQHKLESIEQEWIWVVLTEAWCGDAAQNVPIINKMAKQTINIHLKLLLRDENLEIMDQYLTNGGRSIPKLICLERETLNEIGTWGPRPGDFQEKAMQWKNDPDISKEEWVEKLQKLYAKDKVQTIQTDFKELIENWKS